MVIELFVVETVAPNFFNSVSIAEILSVSFTRQLAIDLRVVGPFANRAKMARVIAASGIFLQSTVIPTICLSFETLIEFERYSTCAPIFFMIFKNSKSPCMLDLLILATSTEPPIAPAAKKYEADEASPSTLIFFGLLNLDEELKEKFVHSLFFLYLIPN